jgi:hypothetical protein
MGIILPGVAEAAPMAMNSFVPSALANDCPMELTKY